MEATATSNVAAVQWMPPTAFVVYGMDNVLEAVLQGSLSLILHARNWVFTVFMAFEPYLLRLNRHLYLKHHPLKSLKQTFWLILYVWVYMTQERVVSSGKAMLLPVCKHYRRLLKLFWRLMG
jgi:hypothetical protein